MYRLQVLAVFGFFLIAPACATQSSTPSAATSGVSTTKPALPKTGQEIKHNKAEVTRLQHEVAKQESDSQRASERLQQQDQQIAELRLKLSQLQRDPTAGQP